MSKLDKRKLSMNKPQTKLRENKFAQLILLEIFSFSIVVSLLDSFSIQPEITSIYFYLLLSLVTALIYKPFRLLLTRSIPFIFSSLFSYIKAFCTTAISFLLHK